VNPARSARGRSREATGLSFLGVESGAKWERLRSWWYSLPKSRREYSIRSGMRQIRKAKNVTPEEQVEAGTAMIAAAGSPHKISQRLRGDLLEEGLKRLASIPGDHCAECKRPVFFHQAIKKDGKLYCEGCAPKPQS
jgi:hypothetical protein